MQRYLIEFLGTFFLVFTVALSGSPIAVGAILIAMIYMGGYISGAHYNPAVTLAVWLRGGMKAKEAVKYMAAQLVGALAAAGVFYAMAQSPFLPTSGQGLGLGLVVTSEILFTLALALTVLHVATSDKIKDNYYYGAAIGLVVMAGGFAVGPVSGAAFNPALGLGTFLVGITEFTSDASKLGTFLAAYVLSPLVGGALAAFVYKITSPKA